MRRPPVARTLSGSASASSTAGSSLRRSSGEAARQASTCFRSCDRIRVIRSFAWSRATGWRGANAVCRVRGIVQSGASIAIVAVAVWRARIPSAGGLVVGHGRFRRAVARSLHPGRRIQHSHPGTMVVASICAVLGLARTPSRFAIVATLGLAILAAGALMSIGARWPHRRRLILSVATMLSVRRVVAGAAHVVFRADLTVLRHNRGRSAADSRSTLPFGVRDGVSSIGNFRARSAIQSDKARQDTDRRLLVPHLTETNCPDAGGIPNHRRADETE